MPEYLAPGVFIEEVSFRSKSIEGVSTTTTGFIGPTRYGPVEGELEVLTALDDFERTYGDNHDLEWADGTRAPNFMWHAVKAFFDNGGSRLYVKRVFLADSKGGGASNGVLGTANSGKAVGVRARFPGVGGDGTVAITLSAGPNALSAGQLIGVREHDVVLYKPAVLSPPLSPPQGGLPQGSGFHLIKADPTTGALSIDGQPSPAADAEVRVVTALVTFTPKPEGSLPISWGGLPLDARHATGGTHDSVFAIFSDDPPSRALERTIPIALHPEAQVKTGIHLLEALEATAAGVLAALMDPTSLPEQRTVTIPLTGGSDGARPGSPEYAGSAIDPDDKTGLKAFEDIEDISIVAAPGATYEATPNAPQWTDDAAAINQEIIGHAQRMRYRIAVLESINGQGVTDVLDYRGQFDSKYAAFYYPWLKVFDPITRAELDVPPAGFVCGIYARNDNTRSVVKAPANEVATGAIGLEKLINKAQQELLNPVGVNCFRFFEGRGFQLWGARTVSADPEWKYVNLRRYFAYLERSLDRGTQWAVFEPNGERLWANVRKTVSDFLFNEFQNGAYLGEKPEQAYFVKCDRSTMSQNDLDNGRLVCLVGVAVLRPAEFVIFRIGQWTADRKV
jgi:phage tail sheath protein FI